MRNANLHDVTVIHCGEVVEEFTTHLDLDCDQDMVKDMVASSWRRKGLSEPPAGLVAEVRRRSQDHLLLRIQAD